MKKLLSHYLLLILGINFLFSVSSVNAFYSPDKLTDTYAEHQKYLRSIMVGTIWHFTQGSPNVVVAVIDDGVYLNHPDLTDNIWVNEDEKNGNGIDDDGNGYTDDYYGWNFIDNSPEMTVKGKHGTMVAGIIGARGDNGIGIAGITWYSKIMPLIACSADRCPIQAMKDAIRYAADNGADVINLSIGFDGTYSYFEEAFDDVIDYAYSKNVIIVAAAGNGDIESGYGKDLNSFPVSPVCNETGDQIIGVSATGGTSEELTSWSNYGGCVQVSAPGESIISTAPLIYSDFTVPYDIGSGTSFSAPIVSGMAALIRSMNRLISNTEAIKIINDSGRDSISQKIDAQKMLSNIGTSVDLFSVDKTMVNPGDYVMVRGNFFKGNYRVKLIGASIFAIPSSDVFFYDETFFRIKIPKNNIKAGTYTLDVEGVRLEDAFTLMNSGHSLLSENVTYDLTENNSLSIEPGWLIKSLKHVEVFHVDENLCLHWIVDEEAAEKHFGVAWNYEGCEIMGSGLATI